MTDPVKPLSDDALRRIETRLKTWTSGGQYPASWDELNALCQTVRVLRADVDKFSVLADERHDLLSKERRRNDGLRQHVDELQRTNEKLTARNVELRQQLAQVTRERNDLFNRLEKLAEKL